jgi:hypothetical protein
MVQVLVLTVYDVRYNLPTSARLDEVKPAASIPCTGLCEYHPVTTHPPAPNHPPTLVQNQKWVVSASLVTKPMPRYVKPKGTQSRAQYVI